jgi:hypothetical protein
MMQPWMLALLALVLAMRVLVPTGFMPVMAAQGMVVTMCTSAGAVDIVVDVDRDGPVKPHQNNDDPCVFAVGLSAGLVAMAGPMLVAPLLTLADPVHDRAIADLTVHRLAAPPPPAIGPPAFL